MLEKVDATSITCQQKMKLFKVSICPHLTLDLSISDLPVSWLWNYLQSIATRLLNRWAHRKRVVFHVKAKIQAKDIAATLAHTTSLPMQGLTVREFEGSVAQNWSTAIFVLPEWVIKFALNVVMDMHTSHNANLRRWKNLFSPWCQLCGVDQSLVHVVNFCQKALDLRCYATRHDDVCAQGHLWLFKVQLGIRDSDHRRANRPAVHPSPGHCPTDLRPDIVIRGTSAIHLVKLTIPFKTNIADAAERKVPGPRCCLCLLPSHGS